MESFYSFFYITILRSKKMALETYVVDKAKAMSRDLAVRLKLTGVAVASETLDAKGFPVLQLGTVGAYEWLSISTDFAQSEAQGTINSLGMPQTVYTPHVCKFYQEAFATSSAAQALLAGQVLSAIGQLGTKIQMYSATGIESAADFAAVLALTPTLDATIPSDYINPLTQQM